MCEKLKPLVVFPPTGKFVETYERDGRTYCIDPRTGTEVDLTVYKMIKLTKDTKF